MQDLINLLQKLDLNQREAQVYLFCLENGPVAIADLSKHLKKDRTIIYRLVDKLINYKILEKEIKSFGPKISAVPPRQLIEIVKREERKWKKIELLFAEHLPQLQGLQNNLKALKPKIYFYEEMEQVKQSWLDHLNQVGSEKVIYSFGASTIETIKNFWPEFDDEYRIVREERSVFLRLLIGDKNKQILALTDRYSSKLWEVRFSEISSQFKVEVQFSASSIHFTMFEPTPSALILENQQLCQFFKILFDQVWQNAQKLGPF